jgi:hypothetical protein
MFGPVFEAARIRFFGFAVVRQERFYGPPNFLRAGALIGALDGGRRRDAARRGTSRRQREK